MNIQELPITFTGTGEVKGFKFMRMMSSDNWYLYQINNGISTHFEVIKRLKSPVCIDFKTHVFSETDFKEYYPKANSFGVNGYSFYNKDQAIDKFKSP